MKHGLAHIFALSLSLALVGGVAAVGATPPAFAQATATESSETSSPQIRERYGKDAPAEGAPYRYRQIGLGLAIIGLMAGLLYWLIRRNTRAKS